MRYTCAFCGRKTEPAVFIGNQAIGPTCAKKAGLLKPQRKGSSVTVVKRKRNQEQCGETMDLFDELRENTYIRHPTNKTQSNHETY